ncbi:dynein regulatory complex subunit 6-like [Aphidius gifuensis]|uniref:dynein regulatory complex subunit 6-like n=1 Tax=Aphidius gifuensis TaxID=684658 RepID=UPI001CDBE960|nr:dynein regulatory complex subunit 6-like [Aphidius gifuensis]
MKPDLANAIVKYCKNLKHLRIHNRNYSMNDTALEKLTELENLECLILGIVELHEESIITISNNCKKLKRLEITGFTIVPSVNKNLNDSTITAIANNCKNLKSLDIQNTTGLTETALVALTNLKNLQKLDVSYLDIITDSFIIKLKGLKELHCNKCKKLTDVGIIQFIKNNPDLEMLDVRCIDNITINMVIAVDQATKNRTNVSSIDGGPLSSQSVLDELSKLQCLKHLNLSHLKNLQDSTIIVIANHCKNLKSLNIQNCTGLTETALVALLNLENLQKVNVSRLDIIKDSFLIKLKGLKELHCDKCKQLTDTGIIQFIKNNPDLEYLTVRCMKNITSNIVIGADQATRNRTNGIILHIETTNQLILDAYNISQLNLNGWLLKL